MLEYDLEIKPTKLIKGQGLEKLMAQSNLRALDINLITTVAEDEDEGGIFLNCLVEEEAQKVMHDFHKFFRMQKSIYEDVDVEIC